MQNSAYEAQAGEGHAVTSDHQEAALHLTLEGLLPANQELVLNLVERTVILFSHGSGATAASLSQVLPP